MKSHKYNYPGDQSEVKCFEYICSLYPKCAAAAGSCCGVDDFFEGRTLSREQCFDIKDKPYYNPKNT